MARATLATFLLLTSCDLSSGSGGSAVTGELTECAALRPDRGVNNGTLPEGCAKIENDQIGQAPQTLDAGGVSVEITGWIEKDGEPGEYVGFTYTATAAVRISIKAGGEVFVEDGDGTWVHPAGTLGSDASGISNIVVCEDEPDGSGDGDPGDGDGTDDGTDDGDPDDGDPDDGDGDGCPDDGDDGCTSHEDCASGICHEGVCVEV